MAGFTHLLHVLFHWPDGIVVGNLIASAIWVLPGVLHLDRLQRKHHKAHVKLMNDHHQEHMTALGVTPGGDPGD